MNLKCTGQLRIKCAKCGHIISIDCSDLPFDVVEAEVREMGTEKTHSTNYAVECSKCGNNISVDYDIWEYPEGVVNDKNIEITGGSLVQECDCEMTE